MEKEPLAPPLPPLNPPPFNTSKVAPAAPLPPLRKSMFLKVIASLALVVTLPQLISIFFSLNRSQSFLPIILFSVIPTASIFILFSKNRKLYHFGVSVLTFVLVAAIIAGGVLMYFLSSWR